MLTVFFSNSGLLINSLDLGKFWLMEVKVVKYKLLKRRYPYLKSEDFSGDCHNALALMCMFTKLAHAQNVVKLNRRLMNY